MKQYQYTGPKHDAGCCPVFGEPNVKICQRCRDIAAGADLDPKLYTGEIRIIKQRWTGTEWVDESFVSHKFGPEFTEYHLHRKLYQMFNPNSRLWDALLEVILADGSTYYRGYATEAWRKFEPAGSVRNFRTHAEKCADPYYLAQRDSGMAQ